MASHFFARGINEYIAITTHGQQPRLPDYAHRPQRDGQRALLHEGLTHASRTASVSQPVSLLLRDADARIRVGVLALRGTELVDVGEDRRYSHVRTAYLRNDVRSCSHG